LDTLVIPIEKYQTYIDVGYTEDTIRHPFLKYRSFT